MTDNNKYIEKLIEMLQSRKANTRYEACEYLRVAPALSARAMNALQNALIDPDAEVAEAAQRASAAHVQRDTKSPVEISSRKRTAVGEIIELSTEDWQKLVDLHEKLSPLLFEAVSLFQDVAFTASNPNMATNAAKLFTKLEPIAKYIFIEDPPFGINEQRINSL